MPQEDLELTTEELVKKYYSAWIEVFNEKLANTLPKHRPNDCAIELKEGATFFYGPIYPTSKEEDEEIQKYLKDNLANGFIRRSISPAAHPVLFQRKKNGELSLCIDYRKLNQQTLRNSYPLPLITVVFEAMRGSKIFSKLDLKSAYNLIRIREGDEFKTAFRTKYGHYEYTVMPFGLTNAPAVFQGFINTVLRDVINKYVQVYLDDIIIYSKSFDEHVKQVQTVLQLLIDNQLVAKISKCEFHKQEVEFLGHIVSSEGIKTDPHKLEDITSWPTPTNIKEVQSFIGFCNYYRRFIKDFSKIARPIHHLTKKDVEFVWNDDCQAAFLKLKELLVSAPVLAYPNQDKPFIVECDASNFAIGGVLSQYGEDDLLHPVYFYSKSLSKAEINYSITEKELLAIKTAFVEWRHLLLGSKFQTQVYSDHRNLLFASKPQLLTQRQARWQEFLSAFDFTIIYRPGKSNGKADQLSVESTTRYLPARTWMNALSFHPKNFKVSITLRTMPV